MNERMIPGLEVEPTIGKYRSDHPSTSVEAAHRLFMPSEKRRQVLRAIAGRGKGLTDEEIRAELIDSGVYVSECGPRVRRIECAQMGWVFDTGQTKNNASGRSAIIWDITRAGLEIIGGC